MNCSYLGFFHGVLNLEQSQPKAGGKEEKRREVRKEGSQQAGKLREKNPFAAQTFLSLSIQSCLQEGRRVFLL